MDDELFGCAVGLTVVCAVLLIISAFMLLVVVVSLMSGG